MAFSVVSSDPQRLMLRNQGTMTNAHAISSVTTVVRAGRNERKRRMNDLSKIHRTHELQELGLSAVLKVELPCLTSRLPSLREQSGRCFHMLQVQ